MARSRKLPLVRRQTQKERSVSFTKRRQGLFNKASELFMLCDAQIAVLVTSPSEKHPKRKMYSFGHPSVPEVIDAFFKKGVPVPLDDQEKRSLVSLWKEVDSIDQHQHHNANGGKKYCLDDFDGSESVDDLKNLVDGLENIVDEAKQRLDHDDDDDDDQYIKYEESDFSNDQMKNWEMINCGNSNWSKISSNTNHVGDEEIKQLLIGNNQDYYYANNNDQYLHLPQDWQLCSPSPALTF